jgi:ABC-2 type transport system permease protein
MGLKAKTVESASNLPMPIIMLPFLGSGFVPTESMPTALGWFADYQPFTPIMETLRGLLFGSSIGNDWILAIGWSVALGVTGYLWAKRLFNRDPSGEAIRISVVQ